MFLVISHSGIFSVLEENFAVTCVRAEAVANLTGKPAYVHPFAESFNKRIKETIIMQTSKYIVVVDNFSPMAGFAKVAAYSESIPMFSTTRKPKIWSNRKEALKAASELGGTARKVGPTVLKELSLTQSNCLV